MKRFAIKDTVEELLTNNPSFRDDDVVLATVIWRQQLTDAGLSWDLSINLLAHHLKNKVLTSYDSITRCRRRLQEINPSLRGELWAQRHAAQAGVIEELRDFEL